MSSALSSTKWPAQPVVATEVRSLLANFFRLVDTKDESAGHQLAQDIFFRDGEWRMPFATIKGFDDIRASRSTFWRGVTSRQHEIKEALIGDLKGLDLMLLGKFTAALEDGTKETADFAGRFLVEFDGDGKPKVRIAQAWASEILKA